MKFATLLQFTDQGLQQIANTTDRAAAFVEQAENAGLQISELLWLSGRYDGLIVFDSPDIETASAVLLQLTKSGNVRTETFPAFDSTDMEQVLT